MSSDQIEVADFDDALETFHRNGWTDGLPIVPPTPERVGRFLAAAGLAADARIGLYEERRVPVLAGKLAINAVMAGCRPEYFPVVVAIIEAMLDPGFPIHVPNSSTGSFTLGFLVNGPIRQQLGMNCHGNMLGPGNRANSSIGRAIRLIQINVLGSVPGAGAPDAPGAANGRAVLDRSMMGQPAKYAGYHMVENEETCPTLLPTHVELGFAPGDSTVTLFLIAGYSWTDAHAEQTPEAWIDTMAHHIVGIGRLQSAGYGILLLPLENARLFTDTGWTKADIRKALYEATRRSVAWVKQSGYKVRYHRERCEPVVPGDLDSFVAMAGSPRPEDLFIVPCGGPAGSWPYYLYGAGGDIRPVTRRIRTATAAPSAAIIEALAPLRAMLAADDYHVELRTDETGNLVARIKAGPRACAECLVPKSMMQGYFDSALRKALVSDVPRLTLIYATDGR